MSMPITAASRAYSNAAKLLGNDGATPLAAPGKPAAEQGDFARLLADNLQSVVDTGKASDHKMMDLVNGKGDMVDVVTAVAQSEVAVESMVAVRDRVISAYEEIMRMPI
jgi:flagellar hook-basal body complex protein FliE